MDTGFQILIIICSLSYKYFLAKRHILGWILAMVTAGLSFVYLLAYKYVPILASLELSFCLLNAYGLYKHSQKKEEMNAVDLVIIALTVFIIGLLTGAELKTNIVWYQVASSAAFLSGVVLLAQKNIVCKVSGWLLYILGCVTYAFVVYNKGAYGLVFVNIVSIFLCVYGIWKEVKMKKISLVAAHIP